METVLQDLHYGLRILRKNPGFTAVALLTLALGIGANTAIFSMVNGVLLRPLPYPDSHELVWFLEVRPQFDSAPLRLPDFLRLQERSQSVNPLGAYSGRSFNLTGAGEPIRISGTEVSSSWFSMLQVKPLRGRTFESEEMQPGKHRVTVLSQNLWQRVFGSDPNLVGGPITLDGESYTVIGIVPSASQYPTWTDLWVPLPLHPERLQQESHYLRVIGRLKPGIGLSAAQAELNGAFRQLLQETPGHTGHSLRLVPMREVIVGNVRRSLLVILGAVGFVLLIACANVANLLLARAASRRKELALRSALGADGRRLIRQLLTENSLLALLGGTLAVPLALGAMQILLSLAPAGVLPATAKIEMSPLILVFTVGLSLVTGIVFGLGPALHSSRLNLYETLKQGGRSQAGTGAGGGLRRGLVVAEITLSIVLLIGAGLMIRSFQWLQEVDFGFRPESTLTLRVAPPESRYPDPVQRETFYRRVLERIAAVPGVEAAGAVDNLPMTGTNTSGPFWIEGRNWDTNETPQLEQVRVSADYFRAIGIPLTQGRSFTRQDYAEAGLPVSIVSQSFVRRFWPDESPLRKRFSLSGTNGPWYQVVGVVGDVRAGIVRDTLHFWLDEEPPPTAYFPDLRGEQLTLIARTATDPLNFVSTLRNQVSAADPLLPAYRIATMQGYVNNAAAKPRFNAFLLGLFAALALLLALVGIYGVISYSVSQRTHEMGIRMALGARPGHILRMVIGQAMGLAGIGVVLGLVISLGMTRFLASLLYGVSATDLTTFVGVPAVLVCTTLLACYVPARRASRVDPMVALRYE